MQTGRRSKETMTLYNFTFYVRLFWEMEDNLSPQNGPPNFGITILGKHYTVSEDNLIWVFQDLGMIRFSNKFCWNGECKNCLITFKIGPGGEEITERACRTPAQEGMMITVMPDLFYKGGSI